jgi:ATP-dependent RNA helicase DeaD
MIRERIMAGQARAKSQGKHIGRIEIYPDFSTVDLPEGMPKDIFEDLARTKVANRPLNITKVDD